MKIETENIKSNPNLYMNIFRNNPLNMINNENLFDMLLKYIGTSYRSVQLVNRFRIITFIKPLYHGIQNDFQVIIPSS